MTRKVIGYDVNGWRDLAVRSWLARAGDGADATGDFPISGGLGTVVRTQAEDGPQMIGGIAAQLAPHGRGGGWGDVIGRPDTRVAVRDLVASPDADPDSLSAALRALGGRADVAVVSIDDAPGDHDNAFDGWISAMRKAGHRRGLHVWRPVLTALWALETRRIDGAGDVAVLSQGANGLFLQELRIRSDGVPAPERRSQGDFFESALGFRRYLGAARTALTQASNGEINVEILDAALSPRRQAIGMPPASELLRLSKGNWAILPELPAPDPMPAELPPKVLHALTRDRPILLETIATGPVRKAFLDTVRQHCGSGLNLVETREDAVARGAFLAAQRAARGTPIYYDFLPQISTIVQPRNSDPVSVDLVPPGNPLPAGQVFRSPVPAQFGLQHNQENLSIYLHKELENRPRQALLKLPIRARQGTRIDLYVEQVPAEGKARLTLRSDALPNPLVVDWGQAEPTEAMTWDELLSSLERPIPTIPNRLTLPATSELWRDHVRRGRGLLSILRAQGTMRSPAWNHFANKLASRNSSGEYCLSSDGAFPADIGAADRALFEDIHAMALNEALDGARGRRPHPDNQVVRVLTWMHKRCDRRLIPELLSAMHAISSDPASHPFSDLRGSAVLIYQGIGRTFGEDDPIREVLTHLRQIPSNEWLPRSHVACAAFLLTRTDAAPCALTDDDVQHMTSVAVRTLFRAQAQLEDGSHSLAHYPPFLMAGLVRWRLIEPFALVFGHDRNADRMHAAITEVLPTFEEFANRHPTIERLRKVLEDVSRELEGEGQNPDLLLDIAAF